MKVAFIGTNSNSFWSKVIKYFTKSQWTHCLLILDDDVEGEALVFESASSGGVKLNFWSRFAHRPYEIYEIKNDTPSLKPMYPYLGSNYGYLQFIGYGIAKIFGLKRNPFGKGLICSEVVLLLLKNTKYAKEFKHLDLNNTAPEDVYKVIAKSKNFTLVSKKD